MRFTVFVAFGLLLVVSVQAQTGAAVLSCVNDKTGADTQLGSADLNRKPAVRFEIETDPARAASIRKLPSKSIAGFAASYGVRQITFHAEVKAAESRLESGRAEIWADVTTVGGAQTLYHLQPVNGGPGDHEPGFDLDAEKDRDISGLDVFPATPDKTIPLFAMQLESHSMGANSGADVTTRHLFDFRTGPPKSLAALDCVRYEGGGACNAYDSFYIPETDLDCKWIAERNDFLCTHTRRNVRLWGNTAWKEVFYLISGEMRWPDEVGPAPPQTLAEWVASLAGAGQSPVGRHTVLPVHGDTHVLWSGHQGTLVASRGETSHPWPKFMFIHGFPRYASEVPVRTLEAGEEKPSIDEEPIRGIAPGILAGSPMTFTVKELGGGGVQFLQVLLAQDGHRSLFWVGIESPRAEALWIATDAAEYDACREAHVAASVAKAQWFGGSRTVATLDVEPRRFLDSEGEGYLVKSKEEGSNQCPQDVRLSWTSETGWQIAGQTRACKSDTVTIRAIAISGTGEITAGPAPILRR